VTHEQRIGAAAISAVLPGFAHAVVERRRAALLWLVAGLVPCVLLPLVGVPAVIALAAVHVVCVGDSWRVVRVDRDKRSWTAPLPTVVVVLGIVGFGFIKWTTEIYKVPSSSMNPTIEIKQHVLADELTVHWRAPKRGEVVFFRYPCDPSRTHIKRVIGLPGDTVEVRCSVVYVNGEPAKTELVKDHDTYTDVDVDGASTKRDVSRYREHLGGFTYEIFHDVDHPTHDGPDDRDFPQRGKPFLPGCQQGEFYEHAEKPTGSIVELKRATPAKPCEPQLHYRVPDGYIFVLGDNRFNSNDSRGFGAVRTSAVTGRLIAAF
jgi:signal peptidase I